MTSILFGIVRISGSLFKCNYIKNKKILINFLCRLWNLHQILNIFEKKIIAVGNVFPKLETVKDLVKPLSWKPVSEPPSTVNVLMGANYFWNPIESTFLIIFDNFVGKWFAKYLYYWILKS